MDYYTSGKTRRRVIIQFETPACFLLANSLRKNELLQPNPLPEKHVGGGQPSESLMGALPRKMFDNLTPKTLY